MVKVSLLLFILGVIFFTIGYSKIYDTSCKEGISIKYVPRDVYNQIFLNKIIPENKKEEKKNNDDLNTIRTVQY